MAIPNIICMGGGGAGSSNNKNVCMVGVTSNCVGLFEEKANKKICPPPPYRYFWNSPNLFYFPQSVYYGLHRLCNLVFFQVGLLWSKLEIIYLIVYFRSFYCGVYWRLCILLYILGRFIVEYIGDYIFYCIF